jgi:hypothetical protein
MSQDALYCFPSPISGAIYLGVPTMAVSLKAFPGRRHSRPPSLFIGSSRASEKLQSLSVSSCEFKQIESDIEATFMLKEATKTHRVEGKVAWFDISMNNTMFVQML